MYTIKITGNLNIFNSLLREKGRKVVGLNNPCNFLEKLFDINFMVWQ